MPHFHENNHVCCLCKHNILISLLVDTLRVWINRYAWIIGTPWSWSCLRHTITWIILLCLPTWWDCRYSCHAVCLMVDGCYLVNGIFVSLRFVPYKFLWSIGNLPQLGLKVDLEYRLSVWLEKYWILNTWNDEFYYYTMQIYLLHFCTWCLFSMSVLFFFRKFENTFEIHSMLSGNIFPPCPLLWISSSCSTTISLMIYLQKFVKVFITFKFSDSLHPIWWPGAFAFWCGWWPWFTTHAEEAALLWSYVKVEDAYDMPHG